ncbi:MAG: hypothetical protein QXJ55_08390 [Candidatus Caldarchaeum sp.]
MHMASENETLIDHINLCLVLLDDHFINVGVAKNLATLFGTTEEDVALGLKATVAFHDYGKAADEYQARLSFPKHEYYSAAAASSSIRDVCWKTECMTAVLWHHMAMRGPNFKADFKSWRKFNAPQTASISEDFINAFRDVIDKHGLSTILSSKPPSRISLEEVSTVVDDVYGKVVDISRGIGLYRRSLGFLRPLLIVDNLAAAFHRGGFYKVFVSDLPNPDEIRRAAQALKKITALNR